MARGKNLSGLFIGAAYAVFLIGSGALGFMTVHRILLFILGVFLIGYSSFFLLIISGLAKKTFPPREDVSLTTRLTMTTLILIVTLVGIWVGGVICYNILTDETFALR